MQTLTLEQIKSGNDITERFARIAWSCIIEPGDTMIHVYVRHHSNFALALQALANGEPFPATLPQFTAEAELALERWSARLNADRITTTINALTRFTIDTVIPGDRDWPTERLERLHDKTPIILYTRGDKSLLNPTSTLPTRDCVERLPYAIAVVGARAATGYGEHVTMELASGLAGRGITVVSGAAYGVDGMAHRAALSLHGKTIAVLAGGVDRFYPSGHEALLNRIVEAGLVVSELPPTQSPTKWRFLQRNRIIAALSDAVIVAEAGWRSGSLNTAGHATDLGIPLGAYPGPVTSAASAGCHRLIREVGATLVTNTDEVVDLVISPAPTTPTTPNGE